MTTRQLKNAIQKDIEELKKLLPIDGVTLEEDDTETWEPDACGELLTEMEKVKTIITSQNGLNDKLEEWSYREEEEEKSNDF